MFENEGTVIPAVSVEGIRNGDKVIITGELRWSPKFGQVVKVGFCS